MRKFWPIILIAALSAAEVMAQSSSPEEALLEFATTDNPQVFERYLPVSVQQALEPLSPTERQQTLTKFLVSRMTEKDGVKIRHTEDPRTLQLVREDRSPATITLRNRFIDGADALLILELKDDRSSQLLLVRLRLEDDDWRVEEFGPWDSRNLESDEFLQQIVPARRNEVHAAAVLRAINTSLVTYSTMFPSLRYAPDLRALSGLPGEQASPEHAFLMGPFLAADPAINEGYIFHYTRISVTHYEITASPVEYGKTGSRNFFMDESGVIRFTTEDRQANERDDPYL